MMEKSMAASSRDALIDTKELAGRLADPRLRLVDASYYLPAQNRDPGTEFEQRHIPGAVRFDIDEISDRSNPLPHMMPSAEDFAEAIGELGIGNDNDVVVYDTTPMFGACRAWWMFRTFGHESVAILDGGLPKWISEGRPTASGGGPPRPTRFAPRYLPEMISDLQGVRAALEENAQVVDARPAQRFVGAVPEPRPGLRSGHMPGATNLPHGTLLDAASGCMLTEAELRRRIEEAGIDPGAPVIVSCGSGVTACAVALGLHLIGARNVRIYDGSWSEWGARPDTPVVTSP
jgi:thiosulfate/3-mercaptopyruvate sulfurtransferase